MAQRVHDDEFRIGTDSEEILVVPMSEEDEQPLAYQSALFHGSEEADRRAEQYSGPGDEAYEERNRKIEQTANMAKYDDAVRGDADQGEE